MRRRKERGGGRIEEEEEERGAGIVLLLSPLELRVYSGSADNWGESCPLLCQHNREREVLSPHR